jgi:general secretion pathway protein D
VGAPVRRALSLRRGARLLALLAPWLLAAAPVLAQPAAPVPIYGIEVDALGERERVLVFAEKPLEGSLEEQDAESLLVVIQGAVLDDSAPRRVAGSPQAGVRMVAAQEAAGAAGPEVRLRITRTPGPPAELTRRGATLAIELARPRRAREGGIPMKFISANLSEIVEKVGRATGQRFIYDDALQGLVTLTSAQPVTPEEALELLHTVLLMKGYVAVPTPTGARKILPLGEGIAEAPWNPSAPGAQSEAPTVTLVHLRGASAEQLVSALQPWVGATALMIAFTPSNSLILAGSEARLRELLTIVGAIDRDSDLPLVVKRLHHRSAGEAAEALLSAYGKPDAARPGLEAWPDERTGALVLRAPPHQMAQARAFLAEFDRPARGRGEIEVVRLKYADPESLAGVLANLQTGAPASPSPVFSEGGISAQAPVSAESLEGRSFALAVDVPTHSLVLHSDPETIGILLDVIDELDRPPPGIEVELIVLQVTTDDSLDLGFDALIPLNKPKSPKDFIGSLIMDPTGGGFLEPASGTGPAFAARFTRAPLVFPIVDSDGNPLPDLLVPRGTAVLTASAGLVNSTTLMRPHLRMLSGEEHELFAGNNLPIPVSSGTEVASNQPFVTSRTIERQDTGVTLRVKPTVGEAGGVRLELEVETSALGPSLPGQNVEEVGPTIRQRKLTSTIHLRDGEFVVVGFAREEAYQRGSVGVPWLKDIPILGWAFKATSDQTLATRLVIAAQARIERSSEEQVADSIRARLAFERASRRHEHVTLTDDTSWGLRIATVADQQEAEAIAARLGSPERPAHVSRWKSEGGPRFDVTLFRFTSLADANQLALELRDQGYEPEPVVLPLEEPRR